MINKSNIGGTLQIIEKEASKYPLPVLERFNEKLKDPFWVLIACLLSLRTKDETTEKVVKILYAGSPSPAKLAAMPIKQLEKILHPTGFFRNKARTVKNTAYLIINKYAGITPDSIDELLTIPGVGRKTANLVVTTAYNKYGICVDTHVHKIFNRWGYLNTRSADETEMELRKTLPKRYWKKINRRLVVFGKNICLSVSPLCSKCPLKEKCPAKGVKKYR
ncbi:MAG TPA: endonuclease III [Firmicutes bacterium]|nr:endonuclease III [Bacillota bacterium]